MRENVSFLMSALIAASLAVCCASETPRSQPIVSSIETDEMSLSADEQCECSDNPDCEALAGWNMCVGSPVCDQETCHCVARPKTLIVCDPSDNTECSVNKCVPETGECAILKFADGHACNLDSSVCTVDDHCVDGQCVAGVKLNCDDGNSCTDDTCDANVGCVMTPTSDVKCDDGQLWTVDDTCVDGTCVGVQVDCDDEDDCTDDSLDRSTGECNHDSVCY